MRDRRRILLADQVEDEVQRQQQDHAPNAGDVEENLREFHVDSCLPPRSRGRDQRSRENSNIV
jgi:hypothetical protein